MRLRVGESEYDCISSIMILYFYIYKLATAWTKQILSLLVYIPGRERSILLGLSWSFNVLSSKNNYKKLNHGEIKSLILDSLLFFWTIDFRFEILLCWRRRLNFFEVFSSRLQPLTHKSMRIIRFDNQNVHYHRLQYMIYFLLYL